MSDLGDNALFTREVGAPVARAIHAFGAGEYAQTVELLRPVRNIAHRFGGSHAQRDVLDLTLIEAALRDSRWISQAVVFGDNKPYLVAAVTLDAEELPALLGKVGATGVDIAAAARAPATLSSSQRIFVAEKYGSSSRPVLAVIPGSCPARRICAQRSAVRRSCQTIAL